MRTIAIFTVAALAAGLATGILAAREQKKLVTRGLLLEATLRREGASVQARLLAQGDALKPALEEMARGIATPIAQAQVFTTLSDYGLTPATLRNFATVARRFA